MRAKQGIVGLHKLLANYQTGDYKFRPTISWKGIIGLRTTSRSFMNSLNNKIHSSVTTKVHDVDQLKFSTVNNAL